MGKSGALTNRRQNLRSEVFTAWRVDKNPLNVRRPEHFGNDALKGDLAALR
jgi:hypothetical protein